MWTEDILMLCQFKLCWKTKTSVLTIIFDLQREKPEQQVKQYCNINKPFYFAHCNLKNKKAKYKTI